MKWAIGLIAVAGGGSAAVAFVFLDGASAMLIAFATLVVIVMGSAPVAFGVLTRGASERAREGPTPMVISARGEDRPRRAPEAAASPPRKPRGRVHRRPRA